MYVHEYNEILTEMCCTNCIMLHDKMVYVLKLSRMQLKHSTQRIMFGLHSYCHLTMWIHGMMMKFMDNFTFLPSFCLHSMRPGFSIRIMSDCALYKHKTDYSKPQCVTDITRFTWYHEISIWWQGWRATSFLHMMNFMLPQWRHFKTDQMALETVKGWKKYVHIWKENIRGKEYY
jgi:hypothetical protein